MDTLRYHEVVEGDLDITNKRGEIARAGDRYGPSVRW